MDPPSTFIRYPEPSPEEKAEQEKWRAFYDAKGQQDTSKPPKPDVIVIATRARLEELAQQKKIILERYK
jgi:hypothetical protein